LVFQYISIPLKSFICLWFSQLKFFVYLQQEAQITTRKPCGCSCTAGTSPMSTMPPQPTSPGSTLAPTLGTNYCNISTCPAPTQNTLCKYTVNYTVDALLLKIEFWSN
jgi:hypothetical protein